MLKRGKTRNDIGSMVVVPLVSHVGLIGILYATKGDEYGFVKDDVDVISAFADQATIAIENSRLIKKSIERERLTREMMLAQEMQRKLLPQNLPTFATLEIDAVSKPAFEVGGDYYDFIQLDSGRIGIVVGDVSGKGVSAAFYMSEVKGIFQALSRIHSSPREFMIKANEALASSIDKSSFVSLIYAIVDVFTGDLTLSRAGHCPMLLVSERDVQYVRPNGMGIGLTGGPLFDEAIEEQSIHLAAGDVCIFYTDGVTEAQRGDQEYGYARLLEITRQTRHKSATAIMEEILGSVSEFIEHRPNHDDLTLVVLKWCGHGKEKEGKSDIS
jgi:serine phosphatase RsbU (regulator of sigma subunit)